MASAAQAQTPINAMMRQAGSARRIHVQDAYAFHAWVATGWAFRNNSLASISGAGADAAGADGLSAFGAALRIEAGMIRFAPQ